MFDENYDEIYNLLVNVSYFIALLHTYKFIILAYRNYIKIYNRYIKDIYYYVIIQFYLFILYISIIFSIQLILKILLYPNNINSINN